MIVCPECLNSRLKDQINNILCLSCKKEYFKKNKFIDFTSSNSNNTEDIANKLWGEDLFNKLFSTPKHYINIKNEFQDDWRNFLKGKLIEIGCGSGSDTKYFSDFSNITHVTSIDIGKNTYNLYKYFKNRMNINIYRASALSLPFSNNNFDILYSYGVFHHTTNPKKCFEEAHRVLKNNAAMYVYLYSDHKNNLFKYCGIKIEKHIMFLMKKLSFGMQNIICFMLSPFMWLAFSLPSFLIKILGFKEFSKKIPMNWGTHPFSLVNDLKDRLMAPINHRFTKKELYKILDGIGFKNIKINEKSTGIFLFCNK